MTWARSELGEDWRCHLVGVRLDTGTSRQCASPPDSAAVFMKLPPREMPQSCWSWYELPHAKCGRHDGSLCSCPVFCIRRSCVLSIKTWFDFKKRALARVADTHRTISETQARPCFCLAMQMFIKNESPLFGAEIAAQWFTGIAVWRPDAATSDFNVFMTTVQSPRSRSVCIFPLRGQPWTSAVFREGVTFKMLQPHPEMWYPAF